MFDKLTSWLISTLGAFGRILLWIVLFLYYFIPLYFLPFPLWANALIIVILMSIGAWSDLFSIPLWIWALVRAVSQPLTIPSYIFFVAFVIYVSLLFHDIIVYITAYNERRKYRLFK